MRWKFTTGLIRDTTSPNFRISSIIAYLMERIMCQSCSFIVGGIFQVCAFLPCIYFCSVLCLYETALSR